MPDIPTLFTTTVKTGPEAWEVLRAAMLGMNFTDDQGNHDVRLIAARIRDELMTMGYELQLTHNPDVKARLERAVVELKRHQENARSHSEKLRLGQKIEGVKLALSYFGDYK